MTTTANPASDHPYGDMCDLLEAAGLNLRAAGRVMALLDVDGIAAAGLLANTVSAAEVVEQLRTLTPAEFASRHGLDLEFVKQFRAEVGQVTR